MRSCMIADCLRSTHPRIALMLSMNMIANATRPKMIPRSRITGSPRLRLRLARPSPWSRVRLRALAGGRGRARRGGAGDELAVVADGLVREAGEGRHRARQLAEPVLGAAGGRRAADGREHAPQQVPRGQRVAGRLHRRAEALHAALEVDERAV